MIQDRRRTLRVAVRLSVLVDMDALDAEYGVRHTARDARDLIQGGTVSAILTDGVIVPRGIILSANVSTTKGY